MSTETALYPCIAALSILSATGWTFFCIEKGMAHHRKQMIDQLTTKLDRAQVVITERNATIKALLPHATPETLRDAERAGWEAAQQGAAQAIRKAANPPA